MIVKTQQMFRSAKLKQPAGTTYPADALAASSPHAVSLFLSEALTFSDLWLAGPPGLEANNIQFRELAMQSVL